MIYGWEDWDLWLSFIEKGIGVYKLPDVHFFYRIKNNCSMIDGLILSVEKQEYSLKTIFINHIDFYILKMGHPFLLFSRLNDVQCSLNTVLSSRDYNVGRFVLKPFRFLKKICQKYQ